MTASAKHAALFEAMNYSRFGALAQLVIMDAFTKSPDFVESRGGETNEELLRRVLRSSPQVADHVEAHIAHVAAVKIEELEQAFAKSGADRMFNPRAWHGAAQEVAAKLAAV